MIVDPDKVEAALYRKSFYEFLKAFWHVIIPEKPVFNWHLKYLCDRAQRICERIFLGEPKDGDLVCNVPPGTSKSSVFSIMLPAWCWTRMPSFRFLGASFAHDLSLDLSRKCRDLIKSEKYQKLFPNIELRSDQDTKSYFVNTKGGMRYSVGAGGSPLGRHFHLIVIDDPINPQEAMSELVIKSTNGWIDGSLSTRKIDAQVSCIILVMQRLHQDDPSAFMLKKGNVRHVCLPATDEYHIYPERMKEYYKDGLLDPIRLPKAVLDNWETYGSYFFSGQYGQDPVPLGGGMFKTDCLKEGFPPKIKMTIRYWDKAGSLGKGDWTAGVKMGMDHTGRIWVLDVQRVRLDAFRREKLIHQTAVIDGSKVRIGVEQEPGSSGKESAENTARTLIGFRVTLNPVSGKGAKEQRWDPLATQINAGNVYYADGPWVKDFKEELKFAPFGSHDDQIDAAAGAMSMLIRGRARVGGLKRHNARIEKESNKTQQARMISGGNL